MEPELARYRPATARSAGRTRGNLQRRFVPELATADCRQNCRHSWRHGPGQDGTTVTNSHGWVDQRARRQIRRHMVRWQLPNSKTGIPPGIVGSNPTLSATF